MQNFDASKGMGVIGKISEDLESTKAKKDRLRKSIMTVMVDCRDFEKHLETSDKCLTECLSELEAREKELDGIKESVNQSCEELKLRVKEIEDKEKELILLQEKGMRELELKAQEWALKKEEFDEEFGKRGVTLSQREKAAEELSEKLEMERNEIEGLQKLMEERLRDVWLKEEGVEQRRKEIEKRAIEVDERERKVSEREKIVGYGVLSAMSLELEREIKMKEEEVRLISEDLEIKEKEIEFRIQVNETRQRTLSTQEKQLEFRKKEYEITQKCLQEVYLKEKECLLEKELLQKEKKELEEKRKELEDRIKAVHGLEIMEKHIEKKKEEVETREKQLEKKKEEVEIREKQLEQRKEQFEITQQKCLQEVLLKENECLLEKELLQKGNKELEEKRKEFEDRIRGIQGLEIREKQLEKKKEEVETREKQLEKEKDEVETREKQLKRKREEVDMTDQQLAKKRKEEYQLEKESLDKENKELELKKKELEVRIKEYEKAISNKFSVELDQLNVRIFLNECEMNLDSPDEVSKDLQSSGDPVFFVLNAVEALYPPYLKSVDMVFEGRVASSFILLLEQLLRLSPLIQPSAKCGALKLARQWKAIIEKENVLEVLGFLYLLASFNLGSVFDAEELISYLEIVAQHQQTPELCRLLGLTDKMPDFIMGLTKGKQFLLAVKYVYEFNLVDKIPPVALLKKYVSCTKTVAKKSRNGGENTPEAQDKVLVDQISALNSVIKCIMDHGLQHEYSPSGLRQRVAQLESSRANLMSLPEPTSEDLPKLESIIIMPSARKAEVKEKENQFHPHPLSENAIINHNQTGLFLRKKSRRFRSAKKCNSSHPNHLLDTKVGLYTVSYGPQLRTL